jgi:hypothetical protein
MSGNGETSVVMKGITHGACDYLLKPVRIEELSNIWQHVVRKLRSEPKEHSASLEDGDRQRRGGAEDADNTSSAADTADGIWRNKKKKEAKEDEEDFEQDNDDPSTLKKPRVVWSVELHQQFVSAVNQLGIDSKSSQEPVGSLRHANFGALSGTFSVLCCPQSSTRMSILGCIADVFCISCRGCAQENLRVDERSRFNTGECCQSSAGVICFLPDI